MLKLQTIVLLTGFLSLTPCALIGQSEPSVRANADDIRQLSDEVHAACDSASAAILPRTPCPT
jgi:hypothetical protein